MDEKDLEQIVRLVTEELLRRQSGAACAAQNDDRARVLVIGPVEAAPELLRKGAVLCPLTEYEANRDIARYDRVLVTALTTLQLVDAALARPGDAACCAIVSALLEGREVDLLESALPHRAHAGKGSPGLYMRLEGYVQTLEGYGVKFFTAERLKPREEPPAKPARFAPPAVPVPRGSARPNESRVITEALALALTARGEETVILPRGAILTPSARDVFTRARVTLKTEEGTEKIL